MLIKLEFALLGSLKGSGFSFPKDECCNGVKGGHGGGYGPEEAESVDGSNGLPEVCAEQAAQAAADAKVEGAEIRRVYERLEQVQREKRNES